MFSSVYIFAVPEELFSTVNLIGNADGVELPAPSDTMTLIVGAITDSDPILR